MAKKRKGKQRDKKPAGRERKVEVEVVTKPLHAAQALSVPLVLLGALMLVLGGGVLIGRITEGWGFPMSEVPNWGRPWGFVLMVAGVAYIVGPLFLFARPFKGSIVLMIISGLSILIGTPLITTSMEILYNLFQETKSRPGWIESAWGYFMIIQVAICVALYKAFPAGTQSADAGQSKSSGTEKTT